jgi:hypothetical protein
MRGLYLLAAPSTPDEVREEAIERVEAGENITFVTGRNERPWLTLRNPLLCEDTSPDRRV